MSDLKIKTLSIESKNYPEPLRDLADPPSLLYYLGNIEEVDWTKCLAVVGSRRMTHYGRQIIERFIPDFVAADVTVVSGFMYGVDTQAHKVTLESGGKTIAVLASGVDICYPPENEKLYKQIINSGGVVLSEYPPAQRPQLWGFPKRNRIVAALSLMGTFVVEAGENSGSLVTAKLAQKLKRKVYAVPGPITSSTSAGTNKLLQNREVKITLKSEDIVAFEHQDGTIKTTTKLVGLEAKIYRKLLQENCTLDELSLSLDLDIVSLSAEISRMVLKGLVEEFDGKLSIKISPTK